MLLIDLLTRKSVPLTAETWRGKKIGELTHKEALEALYSLGKEYSKRIDRAGGSFTPAKNLPTKTRGIWRVIKEFRFGSRKK